MKITKKLEVEIKVLMEDYWQSYLKGDLDNWASFLVDDYQNIGTTEAEIWKSKKEIYDYTSSVLDQMVGLTEVRNKKTEIIPYDSYVMVHEFLDIYIRAEEEWTFYSKVRMSSLIKKIDNNWKILHQHGSYPDSKIIDGEFFAFDTLKSENLKLQEAVKNRTIELEAKNRELEIEASLERVRTVAMGMKKSENLLSICEVSFKELQKLGFDDLRNAVIHVPNDEQKYFMDYDYSDFTGGKIGKVEYGLHPIVDEYLEKIRSAEDAFFEVVIAEDMLEEWNEFRRKSGQMNDKRLEKAEALYYYLFSIGIGDIGISTFKPINDSQIKILKRFRNVFDLAYRRYNDIRTAEAQAREAQIEAALERVRAKSMAMHKSDELADLSFELVKQIQALGISTWFCAFNIYDDDPRGSLEWGSNAQGTYEEYRTPREGIFLRYYEAGQRGETLLVNEICEDECPGHYEYLCSLPGVGEQLLQMRDAGIPFPTSQIDHVAYFKYGYIIFITFKPAHEAHDIFKRFAKVFEQTYTRFLDLQKAEAQAKEAQIEAALERVRSRSMGMQKSEEVGRVSDLLFSELNKLSLDIRGCSVVVIDEDKDKMELWRARSNVAVKPVEITSFKKAMNLLKQNMPDWLPIFSKALSKRKNYLHDELSGERRIQFINTIVEQYNYSEAEKIQLLKNAPEKINTHYIFFKLGYLALLTEQKLSNENLSIIRRFVEVFEFSYTRFLDIKKAEEQAREAQIEVSLERVRSKAMAMHITENLSNTINVFFKELKILGITPIRCGVGQIDEKTRTTNLTTTTAAQQGKSFKIRGKVKQTGHPVLDGIFENWIIQKDYFPVLEGAEIKKYYSVMNKQIPYPDYPEDITQYGNMFYFKEGFVFAWTENKLTEEELQIFRRFTSVLSLTYTRYIDLQQAELRAREAEQQASLDRVRGEIASMRTTEDLEKITPLIWRELINLNINFFRCGVFIIDEPSQIVKVYLTTPAGKSLAALHLPFNSSQLVKQSVKFWKKHKVYKEQWNREQFIAWSRSLVEQGHIKDTEEYRGGEKPPEFLSLHFIPFVQGMLYVGSAAKLTDEEIKTAQKLADSFGVAYARYEDFQKLEAANHRKSLELEEARQLQLAMLPKELPQLPNLDISVYMQTATEVGGDYYDFNVGEGGELTAVIGDATGHGMKAGTIVTITKSLFNSLAQNENILNTFSKISKVIKDMKFKQLSMCLMMLKIHKNKIIISSAAMPPALIYRKKKNRVEEMELKGMPLGAVENFPYQIKDASVGSGDTILLMSDGLPELPNGNSEMYGYDKIMNEFHSVGNRAPEEIIEHLKKSAAEWINGNDPDDDITFVVIKVK